MLRCQDMFSTQEKPSGLMLVDLVRNDIGAILSKEKGNMFRIYLYSLGNYWAAFESSAYRLCRLGGKAVVLPMRVRDLPRLWWPPALTSCGSGNWFPAWTAWNMAKRGASTRPGKPWIATTTCSGMSGRPGLFSMSQWRKLRA